MRDPKEHAYIVRLMYDHTPILDFQKILETLKATCGELSPKKVKKGADMLAVVGAQHGSRSNAAVPSGRHLLDAQ